VRFGVSILPNFVLASVNQEDLLGTEASPIDGGASLLPQRAEGDGILLEMVFLPPKHATSGVVPM